LPLTSSTLAPPIVTALRELGNRVVEVGCRGLSQTTSSSIRANRTTARARVRDADAYISLTTDRSDVIVHDGTKDERRDHLEGRGAPCAIWDLIVAISLLGYGNAKRLIRYRNQMS
jgi:hypothetical protein